MLGNRNGRRCLNEFTRSAIREFMRPNAAVLLTVCLAALAAGPRQLAAEEHVVSGDELRQRIVAANQAREDQLREVQEFLSSEAVKKSLRSADLSVNQVQRAVSLLDDDELTRLANRTRSIANDLRAGALNNQQLTYIVIALATAVVVLIAT